MVDYSEACKLKVINEINGNFCPDEVFLKTRVQEGM